MKGTRSRPNERRTVTAAIDIGLDTVLEALKTYRQSGPMRVASLLHYAEICRVKRVMTPYLEALL